MATPEGKPKVFISYSWGNATTVDRVTKVADYLDGNGIHVEMDQYLEPGENLYRFMEQMVRDPSIDKVLCFCDASYTRKVEAGEGGVGTEAAIITPEVYEQVKGNRDAERHRYIAIALEVDENRQFTLPAMFRSLLVVPMTDPTKDIEVYPELLRIAAGMPKKQRNTSATLPNHLQPQGVSHQLGTEGKSLTARMEAQNQGTLRATAALRDYLNALLSALTELSVDTTLPRRFQIEQVVQANLPLFREFYEVVNAAAKFVEGSVEPVLYEFFQQLIFHNFSYQVPRQQRDFSRIAATEFFVLTLAALIDHRRFDQANALLARAYWERENDLGPKNYGLLVAPPEDFHGDLAERLRPTLRHVAGLEARNYNQADALLYLRGALRGQFWWNRTLVGDWMRNALPVAREVAGRETARPLEALLGLPLAHIVARVDEVSRSSDPHDPLMLRTGLMGSLNYLLSVDHLRKAL